MQANYTAVLPPTDALCVHIGVPSSYTGAEFQVALALVLAALEICCSYKVPCIWGRVAACQNSTCHHSP